MEAGRPKPKLLVIVGPTASGKSELALQIAKKFKGEIIAADSRTVYKGLDIGTAKPSKQDQQIVPHWGLDLVEPGENFTAADFKRYAKAKIAGIKARGHLPIVVGGTGLYIDSLVFDFKLGPKADNDSRAELEKLSIENLHKMIEQKNLEMPENKFNKRHLIRTIERGDRQLKRRLRPPADTLIIGIWPSDEILRRRIHSRAEEMFQEGVIGEAQDLFKNYPSVAPGNIGIVYKTCSEILDGSINLEDGVEAFKCQDWQYARRQRTWFKRNPFIKWFKDARLAEAYLDQVLNT